MGVVDFFIALVFIVIVVVVLNIEKLASDNRLPPEGMKKDWNKATTDIVTKGKDYYYKQNLTGKYDVPDKK